LPSCSDLSHEPEVVNPYDGVILAAADERSLQLARHFLVKFRRTK